MNRLQLRTMLQTVQRHAQHQDQDITAETTSGSTPAIRIATPAEPSSHEYAWPEALSPRPGSLPVQILLFLPHRYTASGSIDRKQLLHDCNIHKIFGVIYAKFQTESAGSQPGCPRHCRKLMYRLTIHRPDHAYQVCAKPSTFRSACRTAMHGAHAVILSDHPSHSSMCTDLSSPPNTYIDVHGFAHRRRQYGHAHPPDPLHAKHPARSHKHPS